MEKESRKGMAFWRKEKTDGPDGTRGKGHTGQEGMEGARNGNGTGRRRKEKQEKGNGLKKNTFLRAGRILLWGMLTFLFCKGVIASLRPDTAQEAGRMIEQFNRELQRNKTVDSEISAFAQNFAREYLTYTAREEQEYRVRLQAYMGKNVPEAVELASGSAQAVYVQAYRMERYSDSQWDVYIAAQVEYTTRSLEEGQAYREEAVSGNTYLKVPVCLEETTGHMIVEDLPLFVNDDLLYREYTRQEYAGTSLDEKATGEIKTAVTNFLKAYCEQDETVIGYYLTQGADKSRFLGLGGRYLFSGVEAVRCCQEAEGGAVICIVEYTAIDSVNQAKLLQRLNLQVRKGADGKYYIEDIDTRTGNLNLKK